MLVYRIIVGNNQTNFKNIAEVSLVEIFALKPSPECEILVDKSFMLNKYGFEITDYDSNLFYGHFKAWRAFKDSRQDYCLIVEDRTSINAPHKENIIKLEQTLKEQTDWDVFFPYNPTDNMDVRQRFPGTILGYHWGSDAYFINKNSVNQLLKIDAIKQSVADEILSLSVTKSLSIYYDNTEVFTFTIDAEIKRAREASIKDKLFASPAWSPETKIQVEWLLNKLSSIAKLGELSLVLCDGTLLGNVRHAQIMPWDDDVDLGLDEQFRGKLYSLLNSCPELTFAVCKYGPNDTEYCKIWSSNGKEIDGWTYKFPFIDIWFYNIVSENVIYNHGTIYLLNDYYPLVPTVFEKADFYTPINPCICLDVTFNDWRQQIRVCSWSHQFERIKFFPLKLDIEVDVCGKMT